jgi:hypothetical protein
MRREILAGAKLDARTEFEMKFVVNAMGAILGGLRLWI